MKGHEMWRVRVHESLQPTLKHYVIVATVLFVVTIVEFMIILPEGFRGQGWTIAPLAILSSLKFAAVIFFYMHLKFDHRLLTWIFLGGLSLSFAIVIALVGLSGAFAPFTKYQYRFMPTPVPGCTFNYEAGGCLEGEIGQVEPAEYEPVASGEVTAGRQIFITGSGEGTATPCVNCHTVSVVPEAIGLLGPNLSHIGTDAADRRADLSASEYIAESIREPEVFIAEGVESAIPGLMLTSITAGLTDADVDALVAFLLEQK